MTLLTTSIGTGLITGIGVTALVYLNCVRQGLPATGRLLRAGACGGGTFGSFLLPCVFSQELSVFVDRALSSSLANWATSRILGLDWVGPSRQSPLVCISRAC